MSINKVILVGRITANPDLHTTQSGVETCKFTIALDRKFADKNSGEKQSDFVTCVAWRQTAKFVSSYFTKGKMIAVEGALRTGRYQDKNHEDVTHYTTEVYVDSVDFVGGKNEGGGQPTQAEKAPQTEKSADMGKPSEYEEVLGDGEIPF